MTSKICHVSYRSLENDLNNLQLSKFREKLCKNTKRGVQYSREREESKKDIENDRERQIVLVTSLSMDTRGRLCCPTSGKINPADKSTASLHIPIIKCLSVCVCVCVCVYVISF